MSICFFFLFVPLYSVVLGRSRSLIQKINLVTFYTNYLSKIICCITCIFLFLRIFLFLSANLVIFFVLTNENHKKFS